MAKNSRIVECGGLFYIYVAGSKPITDFLSENAVELQDDGGVAVNEEMETSVPGVFAIGDIRNTPFKQVVVAAADGCIAAMSIDRFLKGRKKVRVDWGSTMGGTFLFKNSLRSWLVLCGRALSSDPGPPASRAPRQCLRCVDGDPHAGGYRGRTRLLLPRVQHQ